MVWGFPDDRAGNLQGHLEANGLGTLYLMGMAFEGLTVGLTPADPRRALSHDVCGQIETI